MKKTIWVVLLLCLSLMGCIGQPYTEEDIRDEVREDGTLYQLYDAEWNVLERGDAFALYQVGDDIWSSYFTTFDGDLMLDSGHAFPCSNNANWSMHERQIVTGLVCETEVTNVEVNGKNADIIYDDGNSRHWYEVLAQPMDIDEVEVIYTYSNGREETISSFEEE